MVILSHLKLIEDMKDLLFQLKTTNIDYEDCKKA